MSPLLRCAVFIVHHSQLLLETRDSLSEKKLFYTNFKLIELFSLSVSNFNMLMQVSCREAGDIGLFITLVPKVLQ